MKSLEYFNTESFTLFPCGHTATQMDVANIYGKHITNMKGRFCVLDTCGVRIDSVSGLLLK